jgi:hypothetical protein
MGSFLKFGGMITVEHRIEPCGRSGPEVGRSAIRTVRAWGPDGPRVRKAD